MEICSGIPRMKPMLRIRDKTKKLSLADSQLWMMKKWRSVTGQPGWSPCYISEIKLYLSKNWYCFIMIDSMSSEIYEWQLWSPLLGMDCRTVNFQDQWKEMVEDKDCKTCTGLRLLFNNISSKLDEEYCLSQELCLSLWVCVHITFLGRHIRVGMEGLGCRGSWKPNIHLTSLLDNSSFNYFTKSFNFQPELLKILFSKSHFPLHLCKYHYFLENRFLLTALWQPFHCSPSTCHS